MGFYERHILPRFLDCACGTKAVDEMRAKIVPQASGTVLEIGIGSGLNLPFYDEKKVRRVIGLDPAGAMLQRARRRAQAVAFPVEFVALGSERIPLTAASVDTALSTYTLCTIPNPVEALREIARVLKPGGRLLFAEHGLAPEPEVSKWQHRLDAPWGRIAGGCHLNRDMREILTAGGFVFETLETCYERDTPRFMAHMFVGRARKRDDVARLPANDDAPDGNAWHAQGELAVLGVGSS